MEYAFSCTILYFCNIAIKGTKKGAITNSDGVFSIFIEISKDILIISTKKRSYAEELAQKPGILLVKKGFILQ